MYYNQQAAASNQNQVNINLLFFCYCCCFNEIYKIFLKFKNKKLYIITFSYNIIINNNIGSQIIQFKS